MNNRPTDQPNTTLFAIFNQLRLFDPENQIVDTKYEGGEVHYLWNHMTDDDDELRKLYIADAAQIVG